MSSRKQTPDVLGAILGGSGSAETTDSSSAQPTPELAPKPVRAPRPRKPIAAQPAELADSIALPTVALPAPAENAKVEWEYMEVVFRDYRGWRPRLINGRESSGWKSAPPIVDYLKQLGAEGWELVAMSNPVHNEKEAYFKRQKP